MFNIKGFIDCDTTLSSIRLTLSCLNKMRHERLRKKISEKKIQFIQKMNTATLRHIR